MNTDPGKVTAEVYITSSSVEIETLLDMVAFKRNNANQKGKLDNMASAVYALRNIGYRMEAYFVAPMSGNHVFTVSCKSKCNVYFNHGPSLNRTDYRIIEMSSATSRFKFDM